MMTDGLLTLNVNHCQLQIIRILHIASQTHSLYILRLTVFFSFECTLFYTASNSMCSNSEAPK